MKIRIKDFRAIGPQFANIIEGSEHLVKKIKYAQSDRKKGKTILFGYWVAGIGEDVVVLKEECILISVPGEVLAEGLNGDGF